MSIAAGTIEAEITYENANEILADALTDRRINRDVDHRKMKLFMWQSDMNQTIRSLLHNILTVCGEQTDSAVISISGPYNNPVVRCHILTFKVVEWRNNAEEAHNLF